VNSLEIMEGIRCFPSGVFLLLASACWKHIQNVCDPFDTLFGVLVRNPLRYKAANATLSASPFGDFVHLYKNYTVLVFDYKQW